MLLCNIRHIELPVAGSNQWPILVCCDRRWPSMTQVKVFHTTLHSRTFSCCSQGLLQDVLPELHPSGCNDSVKNPVLHIEFTRLMTASFSKQPVLSPCGCKDRLGSVARAWSKQSFRTSCNWYNTHTQTILSASPNCQEWIWGAWWLQATVRKWVRSSIYSSLDPQASSTSTRAIRITLENI